MHLTSPALRYLTAETCPSLPAAIGVWHQKVLPQNRKSRWYAVPTRIVSAPPAQGPSASHPAGSAAAFAAAVGSLAAELPSVRAGSGGAAGRAAPMGRPSSGAAAAGGFAADSPLVRRGAGGADGLGASARCAFGAAAIATDGPALGSLPSWGAHGLRAVRRP